MDMSILNIATVASIVGGVAVLAQTVWRIRTSYKAIDELESELSRMERRWEIERKLQHVLDAIDNYQSDQEVDRVEFVQVELSSSGDDSNRQVVRVRLNDLEPILVEIRDAALKIEEEKRQHIFDALRQESVQGRVNYGLKVLEEARVMENLKSKILPHRRLFA